MTVYRPDPLTGRMTQMPQWRVILTAPAKAWPLVTFALHAPTRAAAITSALELAGSGAQVLQVSREGEW